MKSSSSCLANDQHLSHDLYSDFFRQLWGQKFPQNSSQFPMAKIFFFPIKIDDWLTPYPWRGRPPHVVATTARSSFCCNQPPGAAASTENMDDCKVFSIVGKLNVFNKWFYF